MFYLVNSFNQTIASGHLGYHKLFETISFSQLRNCEFQADGDELEHALYILGRNKSKRVFSFFGNDVVTIVKNWN
jgi:hypothetical protein